MNTPIGPFRFDIGGIDINHWLFFDENGEKGLGFNDKGEHVERPKTMDAYELLPKYADKSYTAEGLLNAREARRQEVRDMHGFMEDRPEMFMDGGYLPDFSEYRFLPNNCQDFANNIVKHYK